MPYIPKEWSKLTLDHDRERDPARLEDDADAVSQVINRLRADAELDLGNNQSPVSSYDPNKYLSAGNQADDDDDLNNTVEPKKPQGPQ